MELREIPRDKYEDYRLDVIFNAYKWDHQFLDENTIAKQVLVLSEEEHQQLQELTELLDQETTSAQLFLNKNIRYTRKLRLAKSIKKQLKNMGSYSPEDHIRLRRYDFHPIVEGGWKISEVNSDVPGGWAEASVLPKIANELFPEENYYTVDFSAFLVAEIAKKLEPPAKIALIHCTAYSDDRQVLQFIGDLLVKHGYQVIFAAADHLSFQNKKAHCLLGGYLGEVDAIIRFSPLEWIIEMKPKRWRGYFDTITPSCNFPIEIYSQTKRFPFVWPLLEKHGLSFSTWKELLPETLEVQAAKNKEGFIYKPAFGRVGERINIVEACKEDELKKILKDVKRFPKQFIAQKRFNTLALTTATKEKYYVCIGSYALQGQAAGYYARLSKTARIDSEAADIPVLIKRSRL